MAQLLFVDVSHSATARHYVNMPMPYALTRVVYHTSCRLVLSSGDAVVIWSETQAISDSEFGSHCSAISLADGNTHISS